MKNKMKRTFAALLCTILLVTCLPAANPIRTASAANVPPYVTAVLENYDEYMARGNSYNYLRIDTNFAYELLADKMASQSSYQKFCMKLGYTLQDTNLTVDDCITYLSTIQTIQGNAMSDNLAGMSEYDVTKGVADYAMDTLGNVVNTIGLGDFEGEIKDITDALGLANDFLDIQLETLDQAKAADMICQNYNNNKVLLQTVYDNATIPELREAAGILLEVAQAQTLYYLDNFNDYEEKVIKTGLDTVNTFSGMEFSDWLKEAGLTKTAGLCEKYGKLWNRFTVALGWSMLCSDIFVGNELRYLNEVIVLDDITACLQKKLDTVDPADVTAYDSRFERLKTWVPLLQSLCCTRLRGEYATSRIAAMHGSLLGAFIGDDKTMDNFFIRAQAILGIEYKAIGEIFIVEDPIVALYYDRALATIKDNNGTVLTEITYDVPKVVSSAIRKEMKEKLNALMVDYFKNYEAEMRKEFENRGLEGDYCNTADLVYRAEGRKDTMAISIPLTSMLYYSGSMRPIHGMRILNLNPQTGEMLTLNDILESADKYSAIGDLLNKYKPNLTGGNSNPGDAWKSGNVNKAGAAWYLTSTGFTAEFEPGSISAYSDGYVTINVPYKELKGILKEDYLNIPERTEKIAALDFDTSSSVNVTPYDTIFTLETPGNHDAHLSITSSEIIYDVFISTNTYYDATYQSYRSDVPLISLNNFGPSTIIMMDVAAFSGDTPNLFISYTNGKGQHLGYVIGVDASGNAIQYDVKVN